MTARSTRRPDSYEQDEDGLCRELVGPWVLEKHARLARYVDISRSVRKKFVGPRGAGATYIELFSGPGRARIKDTNEIIDGSPLVAWKESVRGTARFTQVHIADADPEVLKAAQERLLRAGAKVLAEPGVALETVDKIVSKLDPYGLHFAFLDPYNLEALDFNILKKLATIERMDILMHVSLHDLTRNLRFYAERNPSALDRFAPGWRENIDVQRSASLVRGKILEYWKSLLRAEGMRTTETHELVSGSGGERLYLLAFAARHDRALDFWEKIRSVRANRQPKLL